MEKFCRAVRRHHIKRLKKARANYWGYGWRDQQMDARQLGRLVQSPQACSCAGCGNARRNPWTGLFGSEGKYTLDEQRGFANYREQLDETTDCEISCTDCEI